MSNRKDYERKIEQEKKKQFKWERIKTAAAFLGAIGLKEIISHQLSDRDKPEAEETMVINVTDNSISYNDAFEFVRDTHGAGTIFIYDGQYYNTYYSNEWESLSLNEQSFYTDFINSFTQGTNIWMEQYMYYDPYWNQGVVFEAEIIIDGASSVELITADESFDTEVALESDDFLDTDASDFFDSMLDV